MSVVRTFYPEVRLKTLLNQPGGCTAGEAMDRARQNLESIRDPCIAAVDEKLQTMIREFESGNPESAGVMYRLSNEIFAEAGVMGLSEMSAAAHSFCTLLAASEEGPLPSAAIQVHIDAMRALRHASIAGDKAACEAVLAGLRTLASRR